MSAHGQQWEGSAFDYTSCIEWPLPLHTQMGWRESKAAACRSQLIAGCDHPLSWSTPALGQSSSEVKPHLEAAVSRACAAQPQPLLLLTAAVWPCSRSLPSANSGRHAASPSSSQCCAEMGCSLQQNHHWRSYTWEKGVEMSLLAALWDIGTSASASKSVQPASLSCPTLLN